MEYKNSSSLSYYTLAMFFSVGGGRCLSLCEAVDFQESIREWR